ncbi:hypothetical protein BKA82DRAFT_1001331 [Pisolithus tinctorius]|uniref:Uncharacterized protein n=1 Tax=Pisolithus tinctorius Marx 270 TaxID=870435 RepID=A0A0C3P750_PISTI|nr:hypothetical protein BKA82DRAFT_1001331 [Pisolithus tinctorius]KIO03416.1 hypothetical protein M404DRAFT_1001331 [Pisolithus tinctorius Marx 270]
MSDRPSVNTASYAIHTLDRRVLAYAPPDRVKDTVPPPARPVVAYLEIFQPQRFEISQVEQDENRYYINYLIERNNLLYEQVTAPQKWIITFVPQPGRIAFTIAKEDGKEQWVAPPAGEQGQIRVATINTELDPNALFELSPFTQLS